MKKSKFTESQIIGILREQEQGKSVTDICREHGISQPTFYQWKSKYSGLDVNQLKRVKELESEVAQYKKLVAELTLDNRILKDLNSKKILGPYEKREAVAYAQESYSISLRKACRLVGTTPSVVRYKAKPKDDEPIRRKLREMADLHSRWGFWMMYHRLRALKFTDNNKRVYRIYTEMKFDIRLPGSTSEGLLMITKDSK